MKKIIIPRGKIHPMHDKCEDCFELGKESQKIALCQCEFHKLMWRCPLFRQLSSPGSEKQR